MSNEAETNVQPVLPIPSVWLLHGKGGSPAGTVSKIETALELHWSGLEFVRPILPHHDPSVPAEESVEFLLQQGIPQNSLVLGISLGGLVGARLQELGRGDLQVIAISSPTWADGVTLRAKAPRRMAFYSSGDSVINDRIVAWPRLAVFRRDFEWLTHDTDQHLRYLVRLFDWYLEGDLAKRIDRIRAESSTREELDDVAWKSMAEAPRSRDDSPCTFAQIGHAVQAGSDWEDAWSGWLHRFIFRKDPRCLAEEPPTCFPPSRRAMLAGVAEFFARIYGLPKPTWVEKPEYFLSELNYDNCAISFGGSEYALLMPESDADDYRLRAKTPREMLRRNVVFKARNLTVL